MADFGRRSSSSSSSYEQQHGNNNNLQLDFYPNNKNTWVERRSYSLDSHNNNNNNNNNHHHHQSQFQQNTNGFDPQFHSNKLQKSKTMSSSKIWCFSDPEFKRKKRVASYRAFTVEGKVKGSFKRSFTWIKDKLLYGFW